MESHKPLGIKILGRAKKYAKTKQLMGACALGSSISFYHKKKIKGWAYIMSRKSNYFQLICETDQKKRIEYVSIKNGSRHISS